MKIEGTLEEIIQEIKQRDRDNPDHGIGCACLDTHAGRLRKLFFDEGLYVMKEGYPTSTKSLANLKVVLSYVIR